MIPRRLAPCLLALLLAGAACDGRARPAPKPALSFGFDLWAGYYPAAVAEGTGIYDSLGVAVELRHPGNTDAMLADFGAGKYDLIGVSFADVVTLHNSLPELRVIFCSDESAGADKVVARAGIASPRDLRGKRLGVNMGGFAELFVRTYLRTHGIDDRTVDLIDADAADVPKLLAAHTIDAGETWEPYVTEAVKGGAHPLFSTADTPGLVVDCVATRADVIARRADDLQKFVTGWFLGLDRWRADTAAATPVIARTLGIPTADATWLGIRLFDRAENIRRFAPDAEGSFHKVAATYSEFFSAIGAIRAPFVGDAVLSSTFLP